MRLYHNIGKLYTAHGMSARRGAAMQEVRVVTDAVLLVREDGTLAFAGSREAFAQDPIAAEAAHAERTDCRGLVGLPGFIDSHTHAVFAGDRSSEFVMRATGRSYQEIAAMGGGITASVAQVERASVDEIAAHARRFVRSALGLGTTMMEVKSGYGLTTAGEGKLLEAAHRLAAEGPMEIVTTYLGAHAVRRGVSQADYVEEVIHEQLPALHTKAEFCDVFMDAGYFTADETRRIAREASALGLKIRLHADELAETDGAATAVELGAYSADHLLKVSPRGIAALAASERTIATLLPTTALSIREPYANARALIDAGCAVAIATDCNPGSSMTENMQFVVTLAVIGMQMTPEEALTAATLNAAAALDRAATHGSLERNKVADFVLYDIPHLHYLPYHIAVSDVVSVVKRGTVVAGAAL